MIYAFSLSSSQAVLLSLAELFNANATNAKHIAQRDPPQPNSMADCSSHSAALVG
jgi:hypothetical protein